MTDAIKALRDYLSKSPSVVYPQDVLEYLPAIEAENAKLRELVLYMWDFSCVMPDEPHTSKEELDYSVEVWKRMRELGLEVD